MLFHVVLYQHHVLITSSVRKNRSYCLIQVNILKDKIKFYVENLKRSNKHKLLFLQNH